MLTITSTAPDRRWSVRELGSATAFVLLFAAARARGVTTDLGRELGVRCLDRNRFPPSFGEVLVDIDRKSLQVIPAPLQEPFWLIDSPRNPAFCNDGDRRNQL